MSAGLASPPRQQDTAQQPRLRRLSESLTVLHVLPAAGDAASPAPEAAAVSPPASGEAPRPSLNNASAAMPTLKMTPHTSKP